MDGSILPAGSTIVEVDEDGGVTIRPVAQAEAPDGGFDENLAEKMDDAARSALVQDVLDGISDDEASRQGLDLLGLKIEDVTATKAQKRNVSRLNHPLLL